MQRLVIFIQHCWHHDLAINSHRLNQFILSCRNKGKGEALGQLFERILASLEATGSFPSEGEQGGSPAEPQAQVWTMFQLAQHFDMQGRTGDHLPPHSQDL